MKKKYTLTSDCFVRPAKEKNTFVVYFPLETLIFEVNHDAVELLNALKLDTDFSCNKENIEFLDQLEMMGVVNGKKKKEPFFIPNETPQPENLLLLTSDRCTLKCLYCYRAAEKEGDDMTEEIACAAIDEIFKHAINKNKAKVSIGYHGGGEPTVNWDVLEKSYNYAVKQAEKSGKKLSVSICSNGVISQNKARWLVQHMNNISISLDGYPEIHDLHRPLVNGNGSFEYVAKTLDLFDAFEKKYSVRLTATKHSELQIEDIVRFIAGRFNPVTIGIEPLYLCGRCETSGCKAPNRELFIDGMKKAYQVGKETGVGVFYSGNKVNNLTTRFCGAVGSNFFVTPRGEVTACLEVSQKSDPRAGVFMYGNFNSGSKQFEFDLKKYRKLGEYQVNNFKSCEDCIAKWHCGGDCISKVPDCNNIFDERNDYRCSINKELVTYQLEQIMNKQIKATHYKTY